MRRHGRAAVSQVLPPQTLPRCHRDARAKITPGAEDKLQLVEFISDKILLDAISSSFASFAFVQNAFFWSRLAALGYPWLIIFAELHDVGGLQRIGRTKRHPRAVQSNNLFRLRDALLCLKIESGSRGRSTLPILDVSFFMAAPRLMRFALFPALFFRSKMKNSCVTQLLLYVARVAGKGRMFIDIGRFAESWSGAPVPARATPRKWPFMQAYAPLCGKKEGILKSGLRLGHSEPCPGCRGCLSSFARSASLVSGLPGR